MAQSGGNTDEGMIHTGGGSVNFRGGLAVVLLSWCWLSLNVSCHAGTVPTVRANYGHAIRTEFQAWITSNTFPVRG
jgi:hypothetical protein